MACKFASAEMEPVSSCRTAPSMDRCHGHVAVPWGHGEGGAGQRGGAGETLTQGIRS